MNPQSLQYDTYTRFNIGAATRASNLPTCKDTESMIAVALRGPVVVLRG